MRTTIDIPDSLLSRAKRHMHESNQTFRALVIAALEQKLAKTKSPAFKLRDASVGPKRSAKVSNETINRFIDLQREGTFQQ